jgi:hypothetical protein
MPLSPLSPFSPSIPQLRLAWDATTLAAYMEDPLAYSLQYVGGWRQRATSAPLLWGSLWHAARERFAVGLAHGVDGDELLYTVLDETLDEADRAGLDEAIHPSRQGVNKRTAETLARSIVWWHDLERPKVTAERTALFADANRPAVEVDFALELPITTPLGEPYYLCGYLDELYQDPLGDICVCERKHTTSQCDPRYFRDLKTSVQVLCYNLLAYEWARRGYGRLDSFVFEVCEVGVTFTRFHSHPYRTPEYRLTEWLNTVCYWIKRAEQDAMRGLLDWQILLDPAGLLPLPQSPRRSFARFGPGRAAELGNVDFNDIVDAPPEMRFALLEQHYERQAVWNPLTQRSPAKTMLAPPTATSAIAIQ